MNVGSGLLLWLQQMETADWALCDTSFVSDRPEEERLMERWPGGAQSSGCSRPLNPGAPQVNRPGQ